MFIPTPAFTAPIFIKFSPEFQLVVSGKYKKQSVETGIGDWRGGIGEAAMFEIAALLPYRTGS